MGQTVSKGSSPSAAAAAASGQPSSPDAAVSAASAAGSLSQVLGLVESPEDGPGGVRLQQHRRGEGFAHSWQLEVLRQTKTIHKLTVISYEEFLDNIRQLNEISSRYLDDNGKQLVFAVKKGSDSTILWRATVRIACVKLDAATKNIESCRTLSLKQFIVLFNRLRHQADAVVAGAVGSDPADCCSAQAGRAPQVGLQQVDDVYSQVEEASKDGGARESGGDGVAVPADECVICLERTPELILPCAHSYCLPCIEQWSVSNKTCPVCRETVDDIDEGWIVSEGPDSLEIATEIQKSLLSLSH